MLTAASVLDRWVAPVCSLVATLVAVAGGSLAGIALWGVIAWAAMFGGRALRWAHRTGFRHRVVLAYPGDVLIGGWMTDEQAAAYRRPPGAAPPDDSESVRIIEPGP